jgi:hypothetical protein
MKCSSWPSSSHSNPSHDVSNDSDADSAALTTRSPAAGRIIESR